MLCDVDMQSSSPINSRDQESEVTYAKGHVGQLFSGPFRNYYALLSF